MTKLFQDDRAPTVSQALRVALLRLKPHKSLDAIRAGLEGHHKALADAMGAVADLDDELIAQGAQIKYDDAALDRLVIECAREKRAQIQGASPDKQPSFREIFPSAPSKAMAGGPDSKQDNYVAVVLEGLEASENAALKAKFGPAIVAQQAVVTAAVKQDEALELARAKKDAALDRVVEAARIAFNEAQLDAASLMKDEALVDSLFQFRRERRKDSPAAPGAPVGPAPAREA